MTGFRLLVVAATAWRHADAVLSLETINQTSSTGTGVVSVVRAAENEALPNLLDALEHAKKLGISANASVAAAQVTSVTRAAADLSLLSEVMTVADGCLHHVPSGLKQALATADIDTHRIMEAFELAEKAGVPAEEIQAARNTLDTEIRHRLEHASQGITGGSTGGSTNQTQGGARRLSTSTSGSSSGLPSLVNSLEELGQSITLATNLNYRGEEVTAARRTFEETLTSAAQTTDMTFVERVSAVAETAGVAVPAEYPRWSATMRTLREAAALSENNTENLAELEHAVTVASEAAMPPTVPEFVTVKAKAQACALKALSQTMASLDPNASSVDPAVLDSLLADVKRSKSLGASSTTLTSAASKAKDLALKEIDTDLATDLSDTSAVKDAFEKAATAGASATDIATRTVLLNNKVQARLSAAVSAMAVSPTGAKVKELAMAISVAADLGSVNGTTIAAARSLYEKQLSGTFNTSSTDVFEALVENVERAGLTAPTWMQNRLTALRHAQVASTLPSCQAGDFESYPDLLSAHRRATEAGLPSYAVAVDVQTKVRACAAIKLNSTVGVSGQGLDVYLAALEEAREVSVDAGVLGAASGKIQAAAKSALLSAVGASPVIANDIHEAFSDAERAGVSATDIASAAGSLSNKTAARLTAAKAAVSSANSTTASAIEELAKAINVGSRIETVRNALKAQLASARALYEEKLAMPITSASFDFFAAAAAFADEANVKVPLAVSQMLDSARRLHEAAEGTEDLNQLLLILEESETAHAPNTQDKAAVKERAKQLATAELQAAISGESYDTVRAALTAAVQAGVSQTTLDAARTVISSI